MSTFFALEDAPLTRLHDPNSLDNTSRSCLFALFFAAGSVRYTWRWPSFHIILVFFEPGWALTETIMVSDLFCLFLAGVTYPLVIHHLKLLLVVPAKLAFPWGGVLPI